MKKMSVLIFPLFFALLTLAMFLFLYRPPLNSPEMTSAWLVFLTSLNWSILIVLGPIKARWLKVICAAAVLLVSVLLVEIFKPFPIDRLQHRLMIGLQVLGMVGIVLYLHILKKKGENPHD